MRNIDYNDHMDIASWEVGQRALAEYLALDKQRWLMEGYLARHGAKYIMFGGIISKIEDALACHK